MSWNHLFHTLDIAVGLLVIAAEAEYAITALTGLLVCHCTSLRGACWMFWVVSRKKKCLAVTVARQQDEAKWCSHCATIRCSRMDVYIRGRGGRKPRLARLPVSRSRFEREHLMLPSSFVLAQTMASKKNARARDRAFQLQVETTNNAS